jgi:putative ABC transport system permease protein
MGNLVQDVRYAIRTLLRSPGFTLVAVLTLALGIGANTAIFSLVNAIILKPLPFHEPSRLIAAWDTYEPQFAKIGVSPTEIRAWSEQTDLFEQTGWYRSVSKDLTLTAAGGEAVTVHGTFISSQFLPLLGVTPAIGYAKLRNEPNDASNDVLISDRLWRSRFGNDPAIIGKTVRLNDQAFTITGVMPSTFKFPDFAELWLPEGPLLGDEITNPVRHAVGFVGRLRAGVTEAQAAARLTAIQKRLAAEHPKTSAGWGVRIAGLQDDLTANQRPTLLMLLGAVALVLLIACTNVANLLLARASGRAKEIAVRTALGAGAWRIVRQLLTESLVLSVVGGGLGILIGQWSLAAFSAASAEWQATRSPAPQVLGFAMAISVATGLLFGIAPALQALRQDSNSVMKAGAVAGRGSATRAALVVGEFALALILVTGGGILLKSFVRLMQVDPGFRTQGLVTMRVSFPDSRDAAALYRRIEEKVRQIPGVVGFAATNALPLTTGHGNKTRFNLPGSSLISSDALPIAEMRFVSPDYFSTMRIPVLSGRAFTLHDISADPLSDSVVGSVIINRAFARRYWPDRDPVGQKFITGVWGPKPTWGTIVGVVGDVKQSGLDSEPTFDLYLPDLYPASIVIAVGGVDMSVDTARGAFERRIDASACATSVRQAIHEIDPELPVSEVRTMDEVLGESAKSRRWMMILLACFAGLALVLALVGIYGVMAWSVAQRTREIGVRMALGARSGQVLADVIGYGLRLSLVGMAIGVVGALALRRYLATLVFDVSTADPIVYGAVAALMLGVAMLACYLPARRASRVDPLVALRDQ